MVTCDRSDIDPCSYITNGGYAGALRTELNYLLANCPARNWDCNPTPCCTQPKYYNLDHLFNGLNPWYFCNNRTDCYSYDCSSAPGGGTLCNYGSIVLQDSIVSYVRRVAQQGRPLCESNSSVLGNVYNIYFFYGNYGGSSCEGDDPCFDYYLYLKVDYACPCSGPGE
ncbi:MAG: hypothetical protein ABI851_15290 [Saprospiraceae bacterium]